MAGIAQLYRWLISLHPVVALVRWSINLSILFRSGRSGLVATVMRFALCVTFLQRWNFLPMQAMQCLSMIRRNLTPQLDRFLMEVAY